MGCMYLGNCMKEPCVWQLSWQSFKDVGLVSVVQYKVAHMVDTTNNNIQLLFGTKQFPKGYVKKDIYIYIYLKNYCQIFGESSSQPPNH
jgi:hypothetical protein